MTLNESLVSDLLDLNIGFSSDIAVAIHRNRVEIGIKAEKERAEKGYIFMWASEVDLYPPSLLTPYSEINFASSGAFTPEKEAPYWRTIHAAIILQHWDKVTALCAAYTKEYHKQNS